MRHAVWMGIIGILLCAFGAARAETVDGGILFEQRCAACHSMGAGDRVGPDLAGVTQRRETVWLKRMIREPDQLIAEGDPVVTALVERYNRIVMPNLGLDEASAEALIGYFQMRDSETGTTSPALAPAIFTRPDMGPVPARIWQMFLLISAVIVLVFSVVAFSTRSPREVSSERAYGLRRVLFLAALVAAIGVLATTLPKTPYAAQHDASSAAVDRIIYVAARQFEFIWSDEPITRIEDIGRVPRLDQVVVAAGSTVEFRVTSLDVTHGFGLYGPQRQVVAQTQAMPQYVNRLRVRLDEPGEYPVFCLEYCAAGHHRMRSNLSVR